MILACYFHRLQKRFWSNSSALVILTRFRSVGDSDTIKLWISVWAKAFPTIGLLTSELGLACQFGLIDYLKFFNFDFHELYGVWPIIVKVLCAVDCLSFKKIYAQKSWVLRMIDYTGGIGLDRRWNQQSAENCGNWKQVFYPSSLMSSLAVILFC